MPVTQNPSTRDAETLARGFGLIELIITIAIAAILTTIALPNFGTSIRNSRLKAQSNDMLTAINLARNEAVTRTRGISVCAADTSAGVPSACGDKTDWKKGWVMFIDDTTGSTAPTAITSANVLRNWVAAKDMDVTSDPETNFVRFSPRGESMGGAVTFTIVPEDACTGQQQRVIAISAMGSANSEQLDCP